MKPSLIFSHWASVREGLCATLNRFTDAELAYTPFPGSWSVGQIALHIADAEEGWFRYVATRELNEWPTKYRLESYPTRVEIRNALTDVHARTEAYLLQLDETDLARQIIAPWDAQLTLDWIIWHVLEHEIHHRGELSLILGLLGREGLDV